VDTRRYWLVRKPRVLALLAGTGVALGGLLFAASGCMKAGNPETVEAARVATRFSPFTLTGPQFLAFFVIAFAVVGGSGFAVRRMSRDRKRWNSMRTRLLTLRAGRRPC
jgi:uncharacterized membrane protein YphA (DoxX/SURF4 family)